MDSSVSPILQFQQSLAAFEEADELRSRYEFLARSASRLFGVVGLPLVAAKAAQSAVPELADWCFVDVRGLDDEWRREGVAYRFQVEAAHAETLRSDVFLPEERNHLDPYFEGTTFSGAQSFSLLQGSVRVWFVMTRSCRAFDAARLRLIGDFLPQVEEAFRGAFTYERLRLEVSGHEKMISIASHELKTPLTAMRLLLELMKRETTAKGVETVPVAQLTKFFRMFDRSLAHISHSVGMLFNLSEIRTGKFQVIREETDVSAFLEDVVSRMESILGAADCRLRCSIQAGVMGEIDARRLEQAVVNLLSNAAKYARGSQVEVTLSEHQGQIEIRVRDSGPGIAEGEQARLFEAFKRANGSSTIDGLGLGLYIARGVVHAHGGQVLLKSVLGQGAEFTIQLPAFAAL